MAVNDTKPVFAHRLVAVFFVLFLALQIFVPAVQLSKPRPSHFGWQMFSGLRPIPRYWLVRADGSTQEVTVEEHTGVRRLDADYHRVFADFLLKNYADAIAVRWQWPGSEEVREWCR